MYPQDGDLGAENPVIKAIYPTGGILHRTGESSMVHRREENSIGLSLGVDPYGKLALRHTRSRSHDEWSSPYLLGSGIETNTLLLTMNEDPIAHGGVLPSLDFAVLLYLPSQRTQAFEAQLTVKASPGGELGAALRGMWTNPKIWTLKYDGVTELGHHTCETHSDGSRSVFLASGNSMTGHEGSDAF
ncbi:hypothetical protein CROQUDRAFT_39330 [Cronartium quercuum f. sp. fusiforme G11]|uniref:Uncharacterized protein n=1 Tax=Cronartium quercuum f. sp. fusiforme G11 TaxID=708437 RepID=A0A9P6TEU5_9BASI|nr:hypothetical protein CROQUDRAFT_39330 [Cronartium quercuum f. sp. fusiforme G11]